MAKHDCNVPNTAARKWKCPVCRRVWTFHPNAGKGSDLWHGRENIRHGDGSKVNTTFWSWLTS